MSARTKLLWIYYQFEYTIPGIARSESARSWEGDGFDARPKLRHS